MHGHMCPQSHLSACGTPIYTLALLYFEYCCFAGKVCTPKCGTVRLDLLLHALALPELVISIIACR